MDKVLMLKKGNSQACPLPSSMVMYAAYQVGFDVRVGIYLWNRV